MGGRGASSASSRGSGGSIDPVLGSRGTPKTSSEALAETNPNYRQGREYQVNCQRCVVAYELQRQGYDVEALPATMNGNDPMFAGANWMRTFNGQTWTNQGELGTRSSTVEKNITSRMQSWGDGSRGIVYVAWQGSRSAHVFNVENQGGRVSIFDAQTGKKYSLSQYLSIAKPSKTMLSRVDGLTPNMSVVQHAVKKKG